MITLGIHDGHNATVALTIDGTIKYVIQEERISREKNFDGFPEKSISLILEKSGLKASDVDAVALNGLHQPKPMTRLERIDWFKGLDKAENKIKSSIKKVKNITDLYAAINNKTRISQLTEMGFKKENISFHDHHRCHAVAAYCGSGFKDDVLVLTNDGAGDRVCATVSISKEGKLERIAEVHENHSIGLLYATFTFLTGMVPLEHEYKIMGMAPYADQKGARKVADEFHNMFEISSDGLTWKFVKGPSIYSSLLFFKEFMYLIRFDHLMAGLQVFIEEFLSNWVQACIKKTGAHNVALSGGTFMNVKANKVIRELPEVNNLFIFPSSGDESNSIGAAWSANIDKGIEQISGISDIYWGVEWTDDDILQHFNGFTFSDEVKLVKVSNPEHECAKLLAEGHVVARFNGREEFGARSLGNRAILGNPTNRNVIKEINELIKNRDFWMPFASSILDEDYGKYVFSDEKNDPYYMIMTYDTTKHAAEIEGGIHPYDRTVRPQLVTQAHNASYWSLLKEFKTLTGVGGLLNTSLNLHGLPLVHTPSDAFEVMEKSKLNHLVIGNYLLSKA